jgi:hypothetical protein
LPGEGADEVVELENGATILGRRYPCVIVCMYDVNTVSGRLVLNAGFGTHPLAVRGHALRQTPTSRPMRRQHVLIEPPDDGECFLDIKR